jgi:hypothetical protein
MTKLILIIAMILIIALAIVKPMPKAQVSQPLVGQVVEHPGWTERTVFFNGTVITI